MLLSDIILRLENNKLVFQSLLHSLSPEEYLWKPSPTKWCLLEIACHLVDEEIEDFRTRVRHALETPQKPLKPIHPEVWPKERAYMKRNFDYMLEKLLVERDVSIDWLNTLTHAPWQNAVDHPQLGQLSALHFLENWLAHDYLHIRQINAYKRGYFSEKSSQDLTYAGNW